MSAAGRIAARRALREALDSPLAIIMRNARTKVPPDHQGEPPEGWTEEFKATGRDGRRWSRVWRRRILAARRIAIFAALLVAPALAHAQAPKLECAFLPLCIAKADPPIDELRIYEDGVLRPNGIPPDRIIKPFWWPPGGFRTSILVCTDKPNSVLKPCIVAGGKEYCGGSVTPPPSSIPQACGAVFKSTYTMSGLVTLGQLYATMPATCAKDPVCLKLLADNCVADAECVEKLAKALPDVNQDGEKNGGDYYWWEGILDGGDVGHPGTR